MGVRKYRVLHFSLTSVDGHNDANLDLFKTTDGGVTWTRVYDYDIYESPSSQNIRFGSSPGVWVSENIGYYTFSYSVDGHNDANLDLFKTTDGGVTWTRVYDYDIYESPSSQNIRFGSSPGVWVSENIGHYTFSYSVDGHNDANLDLFKTTDGGVNWTRVYDYDIYESPSSQNIRFGSSPGVWVSENIGYYTFSYSVDGHNDANLDLFKTTDGGVTWTRVYDYDIYESPSSQNIRFGSSPGVWINNQDTDGDGILDTEDLCPDSADDLVGYLMSDDDLHKTIDGGETWTTVYD